MMKECAVWARRRATVPRTEDILAILVEISLRICYEGVLLMVSQVGKRVIIDEAPITPP